MTSPVVFFDLDGTLTDPRRGWVASVRSALERLEAPCPPDDVLAPLIGPSLRTAFSILLDGADEARIARAITLFRERYGVTGLFENDVYAGVEAMLEQVTGRTAAAFVATVKPRVYAERIVQRFGLDRWLAGVWGSELDGRFEAKGELLAALLAKEAIAPAFAVMVGDRSLDVLAAKANGVRSVGVLWGYGSAEELADAGADALCASPAELPACLARLI